VQSEIIKLSHNKTAYNYNNNNYYY